MKIIIHRIIIVLVDLYGCETWSHTIRKERRLKVFENRVLTEREREREREREIWCEDGGRKGILETKKY
jgi:hypothetical protein